MKNTCHLIGKLHRNLFCPTFWLVGKVGETIGEIGKQKNSKVNFFTAAIKESVLCCESDFIYLNGGSVVKNLPAVRETWVQSLSQKDLPEKERAAHSSILTWRIPWSEEPGGLHSTE